MTGPLLAWLLLTALPIATVEAIWESGAPLSPSVVTDLVPYVLVQTLSGLVWIVYVAILLVLIVRWGRGHSPGLIGSAALLAAWPQIGHLAPNFAVFDPDSWLDLGSLAAHRIGAALWLGSLSVLLVWSRPGGPAARPWGAAFARLAVPGALLLVAGGLVTLIDHGGLAAMLTPSPFALLVDLKLLLLLTIGLLGLRHFRAHRRPDAAVPPRTLVAEAGLALLAAILGAVLGVLPSPVV